ncbi:MAG: chemotaxis protein CheB [Gemmatimonadota bacterium]
MTTGGRGTEGPDVRDVPTAGAPYTRSGPPPPPSHPTVVGIGASAGGLAAFTRLVRALPADTGMAYVLVQHLDPSHDSLLPEILGRSASVPVVLAEDGMGVVANHAYVIPPGAIMTLTDGHLRVVQSPRLRGVHTVIDAFLVSLADVHGSDAIGVILSGAGSDGAVGIEAIKQAGGITLAQDSASAQVASMPDRAVATGCVDFVLAPEQIAERLTDIARAAREGDGSAERAQHDEDATKILLLLRNRTGVDFRHYRRATVHRRIVRRMIAHKTETRGEYLAHVREHPEELDALHEDLLIGVTRFFRDPETFDALARLGFPQLMRGRAPDAPIRVWVAGCSTGEEVYSLAIVLLEFLGELAAETEIQIFATDLSASAITHARAGLYPYSIAADVSAERLRRFFVSEDAGYRITRRVRDLCVFATHNLFRDPPFSQLDLITCRNVLIYFDATLQQAVMPVFHYALNPGGLLLIGPAESASSEHFTPFDKHHRIFRPKPNARRTSNLELSLRAEPKAATRVVAARAPGQSPSSAVERDADRVVLNRIGPPGVVINDRLEILQFRGDTAGFLQIAPGTASLHLLKLARAELIPRFRAAFERARASGTDAREVNIVLRDGDVVRHVSIDVLPFQSAATNERLYVVLFRHELASVSLAQSPFEREPAGHASHEGGAANEVAQLRELLAEAKRHLQDVIAQYETANEDLRAANEEIQSSNEEFQSTNEELETTKEEVQSTNEELTTVNEELRHRSRDLATISGDLANIFASTQIPILIVDGHLIIRRFTPATDRVFRVIATDVGRPLGDVKLRVDYPELEARVLETIATLIVTHADVRDDRGNWWALTVRPYVGVDRKVDGAVLVFTDIDASKKAGASAEETSESRRLLLIDAVAARSEAVEANSTKASFLASMSHDLRTPLNAIGGYADLMQLEIHGPLTQEQHSDLLRIKRSARHLLSLINDILNFAKVEAGHVEFHIVGVSATHALGLLQTMIDPQLREKGLEFACGTFEVSFFADEEKLQQILINLATNAIKFTDRGTIGVLVRADESTVTLEMSDTGRGIAEHQLQRIFDPFVQVNRNLTSVGIEGVGLGLAISRELARRMGGELSVRSMLGEGSTFVLTLPRAQ